MLGYGRIFHISRKREGGACSDRGACSGFYGKLNVQKKKTFRDVIA